MTIKEAADRLDKAIEIAERYSKPGTLTLVEDAPPEAEEALKIVLNWLEINACEWD